MILVDTSAWIGFFRDQAPVAEILDRILEDDEAAICGPILTELRRGLVGAAERRKTLPLLSACHPLSQPQNLWNEAGELGYALARKGITVKSLDLLIACHALVHDVPILTLDKDFRLMAGAGVGLRLIEL